MSENPLIPSRAPLPGEADPHFGTEEAMLAWCEQENLTPVKDPRGDWDWHSVWESYQARCGEAEEGAGSAKDPRPETTPGVFLEHFDLCWPMADGSETIVYPHLLAAARDAAALAGWVFRSYSSKETPGSDDDWIRRNIRAFPTLILFRDGVELGRHTYVNNSVRGVQSWGNKLLGIETEELPSAPVPEWLCEGSIITPDGMVLRKDPAPAASARNPCGTGDGMSDPEDG